MDTPIKIKNKVNLFLCLHNDISKNLLLPNIGTFNMFRNQFENAMNLKEHIVVEWTHTDFVFNYTPMDGNIIS
jgi:hypothetical protein